MREKILVVDDSSFARMVVAKCVHMARRDSNVVQAADGAQALDILKKGGVDLVVADLNMPVMDGRGLLRRIKASASLSNTPVIIVSSLVNSETVTALMGAGALAVLRKPVRPADLARALAA